MDKAEYRSRLEEINRLAEEGKFHEAAAASDGVDWRHVKSARTLCMIGEIYEADKRYEDSVRVLKYAYRRSSTSKTVLYRLADLEIRIRNFDEAKKYMEEFERNSPGDMSRYILKYKLLRAQKAPLDDQIEVLREYKDNEYTERWAYELAKLYKRNGQKEKCIEECDDMILWFAEGKYVTKALELKKSLTALTPSQQAKYDAAMSALSAKKTEEENESGPDGEAEPTMDAIENVEKTILASDEEDDDAHTDIRADEAISKLDSAAGRFGSERRTDAGGRENPEKNTAHSERITDRISHGFRSILSGMKLEDDEEKRTEKAETDSVKKTPSASAEGVPSASPKESVPEETPAGAEQTAAKDEGTFDFEALFAETGSALAGEVASGDYTLTDSLKNDVDESSEKKDQEKTHDGDASGDGGEKKDVTAEDPAKEETEDSLTARETDESLGLTREFHFTEELKKAAAKNDSGAEGEQTPISDPEEAAKRTVLEEGGKEADGSKKTADDEKENPDARDAEDAEKENADDSDMKLVEDGGDADDSDMKLAEDRGEADEDLLAAFGDEEKDTEDLPAEEEEQVKDEFREEQRISDDAVEAIVSEPETFVTVPVEGRAFTEDEKKIMSYFASIPGIDMQTTAAVADIHNNCGDKTSKSGNIVLMGRPGSGKTRLADGIVLLAAKDLGISAVRVGKIVADEFNKKDPADVVRKLSGGFLVIEGAGALSDESVEKLNQAMEFRTDDLVVILEDEKADVTALLAKHPEFAAKFTSRITVPVFTNDELVSFGKTYAYEEGYKLDEMATLALYTMIGDNQKASEPVTVARVREMVDRAISKSNRRLFGKTTDKNDGHTFLQEKDFAV